MKKVYKKPEFEVIKQNQANAKFFVASMENGGGTPPTASNQASEYNRGSAFANETTNSDGGFTF